MARAKKDQYRYVPHEERPEFLALVADLADVPAEEFAGRAKQIAGHYHDAVLAGHVEVLDQMESAYSALVYKLNGETMMGCKADDDSAGHVLARDVAATPGQVPGWGQAGEFLLEVEGVRVWVVMTHHMLGNHRACDLHAVDLDKPFISETGYRSAGLTVTSNIGDTVDQAARRMVLDVMHSEGKLKAIEANAWSRTNPKKRPAWLVDALAGVRADGQLAMFGDAPIDPAAKVPLSNAQRQKAFRERKRAEKEAAKEEGLVSLTLGRDDLSYMWWAMSVFLTARRDLEHLKQPYVRERLAKIFGGLPFWTPEALERLDQDQGILNGEKQVELERKRGWEEYEKYRKIATAQGKELAEARAEIERLKSGLQAIAAEISGVPAPIEVAAPVAPDVAPKPAKAVKRARLSANMAWVLEGICAGKPADHGCGGRSEHGARGQTLIALRERGLLDASDQPTEAARVMFAKDGQ
jgi:hypothetical protein